MKLSYSCFERSVPGLPSRTECVRHSDENFYFYAVSGTSSQKAKPKKFIV
jgi:hypothetical protein